MKKKENKQSIEENFNELKEDTFRRQGIQKNKQALAGKYQGDNQRLT